MPLHKPDVRRSITPGARVRVRQLVRVGIRSWPLEVSGVVRELTPITTGLHTARVGNADVWVESMLLEKPDGELTRVTFDENTEVEIV